MRRGVKVQEKTQVTKTLHQILQKLDAELRELEGKRSFIRMLKNKWWPEARKWLETHDSGLGELYHQATLIDAYGGDFDRFVAEHLEPLEKQLTSKISLIRVVKASLRVILEVLEK